MKKLVLIFLAFTFWSGIAHAQIVFSPVNTGLGGGGTAFTTGYESLFINPANLYIQEKNYRLQLSTMNIGGYYSSPLPETDYSTQLERHINLFEHYDNHQVVPLQGSESVLSRNFPNTRLVSEHQAITEIHWFGLHWAASERSYAISLRSRFGNRFGIGRNFYDNSPVDLDDFFEFNRSFLQQYQSLHELSFGYAESFTFFNGLFPQLSQLIIGIAPKLIASGPYFDIKLDDRSTRIADSAEYQTEKNFRYLSTGVFTDQSRQFISSQEPGHTGMHTFGTTEHLQPTGFGAGLDFGLTYLITLGDDISVVRVTDATTRKSLRVSFSITDIGFVNYSKNPASFQFDAFETEGREFESPSETLFMGNPGEHFYFLSNNGDHPLTGINSSEFENFTVMLPTKLNAGALFQINRVKLMGDFSLGLTNNAFNSTRFITYLGAEIRPIPFLPLRAGTRLAHNLPGYYSFGAGIETRFFDLNVAVQLRSRSAGPTTELAGFTVAAFRFYIP